MATYAGAEDLISVGAYVKGSNPEIDEAIEKYPDIEKFLIQRIEEKAPLAETLRAAGQIAGIEIPDEEIGAACARTKSAGHRGRRRCHGMRRFQFRLERFLDLRRWKEREWEIALSKILGECLLLENRITEIGTEIGASRLAVFTDGARVDVEAMARRELYVQRLAVERERARVTLVEKRREMEKVRAQVPGGLEGAQGPGQAEGAQRRGSTTSASATKSTGRWTT